MTDTRKKSISEAVANILPGYWINFFANLAILPLFAQGIAKADPLTFVWIGIIYTFISIARQYLFRRLFERFGEKETLYSLIKKGIAKLRRKKEPHDPIAAVEALNAITALQVGTFEAMPINALDGAWEGDPRLRRYVGRP